MALGELRRYQAKIDLERVRIGDFDPLQPTNGPEVGEGDWVFLFVPRPWKGYNPNESLVPRAFTFKNTQSFYQSGGEVRLSAFDAKDSVISVSRNCTVIESNGDDLGGGA